MDLDVRRLRVLREVAHRGTITAAADALGYTPSAISQQLSALERESGTDLLERTGRGVRLTDAGHLLVARTEPVLVALEEARAALEESRTTLAGELHVAATGSIAAALVIPVAALVPERHPGLVVSVAQLDADEALRELRLGELDLVVTHEYDHDRRPPEPDLVRVDLFVEPMVVAAPAGRFQGPVVLSELVDEVWAAEGPNSSCGRALRRTCRAAGFEPNVRYTSTENAIVLSAVAHAGAVSLLPMLAVASVPPGVDVLPVADVRTQRLVFVARRRGTPMRPTVAAVLALLEEAAATRTTSALSTASAAAAS